MKSMTDLKKYYKFIDIADNNYSELLSILQIKHANRKTRLENVFSIVNPKTVIIESKYVDQDYRDTYYNYYSKKHNSYSRFCIRLHFFSSTVSESEIYTKNEFPDYQGYLIIRPTEEHIIGRTLLNHKLIYNKNSLICSAEYKVNFLGREFAIKGFPFISQDVEAVRCAHAVLWMLLRYFSQRYTYYNEVLPFDIINALRSYSSERQLPSKGLTANEISRALSLFRFEPLIYIARVDKQTSDIEELRRMVCYYIESGIPIISDYNSSHAIAIIGHDNSEYGTLQSRNVGFNGIDFKIFDTADSIKNLIVHDDQKIPYGKVSVSELFQEDPKRGISTIIVPLYEKIYMPAEKARSIALSLLLASRQSYKSVQAINKDIIPLDEPVVRLLLTSSRSFKKKIMQNQMPGGISQYYLNLPMPKFIWILELTSPDLWEKGRKLGEIILDATGISNSSCLSIRYCNHIIDMRESVTSYKSGSVFECDIYRSNLKGANDEL